MRSYSSRRTPKSLLIQEPQEVESETEVETAPTVESLSPVLTTITIPTTTEPTVNGDDIEQHPAFIRLQNQVQQLQATVELLLKQQKNKRPRTTLFGEELIEEDEEFDVEPDKSLKINTST